jgi:hypothetical protein
MLPLKANKFSCIKILFESNFENSNSLLLMMMILSCQWCAGDNQGKREPQNQEPHEHFGSPPCFFCSFLIHVTGKRRKQRKPQRLCWHWHEIERERTSNGCSAFSQNRMHHLGSKRREKKMDLLRLLLNQPCLYLGSCSIIHAHSKKRYFIENERKFVACGCSSKGRCETLRDTQPNFNFFDSVEGALLHSVLKPKNLK